MNYIDKLNIVRLSGFKKFDIPYPSKDDVFFLNGFSLYHSGKDYWIIKGMFPRHVLKEISSKSSILDIRVGHNTFNINNLKNLKHKNLVDFYNYYLFNKDKIDLIEFENNCNKILEKCIKDDLDNCYIDEFKIYSTEGVIFISKIIKENNLKTEWF